MKKRILAILSVLVLLSALIAAVPVGSAGQDESAPFRVTDDRPDPLSSEQRANRATALDAVLYGKAMEGESYAVANGQYVELAREGEDPVWTVLGEFGDFPHNNIAEPDHDYDNTTIWTEDFSRDYFVELLYSEEEGANSMRNFYIEQSSNRYTVYGDATEWALAPNDAATYDDDLGGPAVWQFLIDTTSSWYDMQIAAGKTPAEIDEYLSQFDVWGRYDWDEDGNIRAFGVVGIAFIRISSPESAVQAGQDCTTRRSSVVQCSDWTPVLAAPVQGFQTCTAARMPGPIPVFRLFLGVHLRVTSLGPLE